jgi:hypothetical protein
MEGLFSMEIAIIQFTAAPDTSSALGPNILYSILSLNNLNLFFPLCENESTVIFFFTFLILHFWIVRRKKKYSDSSVSK